jgi:polysaccharide pyruvyl transferase WcaK-like protein
MTTTKALRIMLHYAWSHGSTGDMGIAPGMLALLRETLPQAQISLLSMRSGDGYHETKDYLQSLYPDVSVYEDPFASLLSAKEPERRWWQLFQIALDPEGAVARAAQNHPEAVAAWRDADLRMYTPSMQLTYHPKGGPSGLRFWLPVILAQRLSLPYALYGQSLGDIKWPGDEMLQMFLQDAVMATARDMTSLEYFRAVGIDTPLMGFVPDTTVFYDRKDGAWAEDFLRQEGLTAGEYLLVLPRTYGFWGVQPSEQVQSARMHKMAQAIEGWIEQTDCQALIFLSEVTRSVGM